MFISESYIFLSCCFLFTVTLDALTELSSVTSSLARSRGGGDSGSVGGRGEVLGHSLRSMLESYLALSRAGLVQV